MMGGEPPHMRSRRAAAEQSLLKTCGFAALAIVVLASGCSGQKSATSGPTAPTPPAGGPPAPMPTGAVSGRIESLDTVADLITYNQAANVGLSIPVEGAIQRTSGILTRWELPIPVYVDPSITGNCVGEALAYWQSVTGLTYVLVGADAEPRLTVRAAGSDELNIAIGSGLVYRTYPNNRARLGVVKILTSNATCSAPSALFRHELGHTLGIFGHPPGGLMSAPMVGTAASQREINLLVQLYRLPHGARIDPDGSWRVVPQ
jgi:hypothetical protein